MDSTKDNNNNLFLCELKELRNELSTVKKRIVQLEESHEKQQERIDILVRENHALKIQLNIDGNTTASLMKRKRTDREQDNKEETVSKSTSASKGKKTKTNNNDDGDDGVVISRYDNGDSFDSLSDDLLHKIVEFDGSCYSKFGSINKRCKNIYDVKEYKLKKQTCLYGYATVDMILEQYLTQRTEGELTEGVIYHIAIAVMIYNRLDAIDWIIQLGDNELFIKVCFFAACYGRIDILTKAFLKSNVTMLDKIIDDGSLCYAAAWNGKLETLKWLRNHSCSWDSRTFYLARQRGFDEIVQYLRDEGCPEPSEDGNEFTVRF